MYDHDNSPAAGTLNGLDVAAYKETIEAVRADPPLARFEFRASNAWNGGGLNVTTIAGFYGAGEEQRSDGHSFRLTSDEPAILFGTDTAPAPVEALLHALAACLTSTIVYKGSVRGIAIRSITSEFHADLDASRFIEISEDGRLGFRDIRAKFHVDADAAVEEIEALLGFSPVLDIVQNPTPVVLTVEKA